MHMGKTHSCEGWQDEQLVIANKHFADSLGASDNFKLVQAPKVEDPNPWLQENVHKLPYICFT